MPMQNPDVKNESSAEDSKEIKSLSTVTTPHYGHRFLPATLEQARDLARVLAASNIVPKEFQGNPSNTLIAIMLGAEVGITPVQALQSIMVVNGRPSLWGDVVMALVKGSAVYESSSDSFDPQTEGGTAIFRVKRKGEDWLERRFSMDDAKKAGLSSKPGPWQNYPKRMLFQRARAFALRDAFPDVLKGIRITEEQQDVIETIAVKEEAIVPAQSAAKEARQALSETETKASAPESTEPIKTEVKSEAPQQPAVAQSPKKRPF